MKKTLIAIAAASVLLLSACGSDGSSADTTVAAAEETEMATDVGNIVEVAQGNRRGGACACAGDGDVAGAAVICGSASSAEGCRDG